MPQRPQPESRAAKTAKIVTAAANGETRAAAAQRLGVSPTSLTRATGGWGEKRRNLNPRSR